MRLLLHKQPINVTIKLEIDTVDRATLTIETLDTATEEAVETDTEEKETLEY